MPLRPDPHRPPLTFVGIGGERCGSTWYAELLRAHPDVTLSLVKEVDYFSRHFERGWGWYSKYFPHPRGLAVGEVSPSYLYHPLAAERMAEAYPDLRILCILRDPYQRAISHLLLIAQTRFGRLSNVGGADLRRLAASEPRFIDRSLYSPGLARYSECFGKGAIELWEFVQIASEPGALAESIYRAVGVDPDVRPPIMDEKVNDAKDYRFHGVFRALRSASQAAQSMRVSRPIVEVLQRAGVRRRVMRLFEIRRGRPDVDFHDVFPAGSAERIAEDMERLEALVGSGFTASWRR